MGGQDRPWKVPRTLAKTLRRVAKVSVKYTEKAGDKTAVGVKNLGKASAKAVH